MRLLALSFLLTLLDKTEASKGTSLDLALETVLEFNDAFDPDILDKIKGIVSDIRNAFIEKPQENVSDKKKKPYEFVDFLKDAIITTNYFKDDKLLELFDIIHSELNQLDLKNVDYLRGYLENNVANMKRDSRKARKNLDNLLNNLRNKNGNRKDNFYLNFINSLYKRNSEQKFVKILNRLNVFRRSDTGDELRKFIKKAFQDLVSELNMSDEKRRILRRWYEDHKQNLKNDRALSDVDYDNVPSKLPTYKLKLKSVTFHKANVTNTKYPNEKPNTKKDRVKLTHVTLYPENMDVIDKRKFITDMKFQSEFHEDVPTDRIESETRERSSSTSDGDSSNSDDESDTRVLSNEITNSVDMNTKYRRTTHRTRKSSISYKTKKIGKLQNEHEISNRNYDNYGKTSSSSASASFEQFGNLHKHKKKTSKKRNTTYKTKNNSTSPYKIIETDKNRRAYNPEPSKIETKKTSMKETIKNLQFNKMLSNDLKNISKSHNSRRTNFLTSNTDVITKSINENLLNNTNITSLNGTKEYLLNTQVTKTSKAFENKIEEVETTTTQLATEIASQTTFNINNYIKNSEIQNIENVEKKNVIEQKMKEDLDNLFSTTTASTTTEAYADIFKDMEDEFELS